MKRYAQMVPIIERLMPVNIIEVGVHRAVRAAMMCDVPLQRGLKVHYTGFDVFETMTEKFQQQALNGKGMATEGAARARLAHVQWKYPGLFTFEFVVGDTRETLHGSSYDGVGRNKPDFVFIDGDHRVDAIEGDYTALQDAKCVVFDDYYMPDENGYTVDLNKYGANAVVNALRGCGGKVEILPQGDRTKDGGVSHLAVVWRE